MKCSIKWQFTLIFSSVIAGTIIVVWVINALFLNVFYQNQKKNVLITAYQEINTANNEGVIDSDEFDVIFHSAASRNNLEMLIMDNKSKTIKTTTGDNGIFERRLLDYILFGTSNDEIITSNDSYTIQKVMDKRARSEYLELWAILEDGKMVLLRTPMEGMKESARISNRFLLYVGLFGVLISIILTLILSQKVAKPILELTEISEKMARLDFNAKYMGGEHNEIDELGRHINQLSESLESTISELKTANNELKKDLDKKNQLEEMRKEFLSNVSHELKTPIALVQGYAEGLKDNITSNAEDREYYCDVIIDEAERMNKIVRNLLELNQLERGIDNIVMERFDVAELISNCLKTFDLLIKQENIKVDFNSEIPCFVWADEFEIEQVVNNYISNAIHYCKYDKIISIKVNANDECVRVSVFNTGDPIPEDAIEHIWTKFFKVDKARTREYGGSGIGLSIVKAIMESINRGYGVINHNNGVEFWFELDGKSK